MTKKRRPLSYSKLTIGITEPRGKKKPHKYKYTVETSIVGNNLEDVLHLNPKLESKFHMKIGLRKDAKIKLINFKILHNQGLTMYDL